MSQGDRGVSERKEVEREGTVGSRKEGRKEGRKTGVPSGEMD